jgi:hypothetical protein
VGRGTLWHYGWTLHWQSISVTPGLPVPLASPILLPHPHWQDVEGPIGRLLRGTRLSVGNTRAATFAYFTGVHPDGTCWPPATWHFFLHLLHGLQLLLAGEGDMAPGKPGQ